MILAEAERASGAEGHWFESSQAYHLKPLSPFDFQPFRAFITNRRGPHAACLLPFDNLRRVHLGFDTENVATFRVRPATAYSENRKLEVLRSMIEGLAAVPGVKAVGANSTALVTGSQSDGPITIPGIAERNGESPWSYFNAITPGYFQALGIPVIEGRDLTWRDWESPRPLCMVNQTLVEEYLNGANPGWRLMGRGRKAAPDIEIIGVFGNAKYEDVRARISRQVFVSLHTRISRTSSVTVCARIQGNPRAVMPQLRAQVCRVDPNLVISDIRTLDEQLNMNLFHERMLSFLSRAFALLAALLAGVGLYGVLSFVVAGRTHEIGIRLALGAKRGRVVRMVLREALAAILVGLVAWMTVAMLCGRFVESQLFGVRANDSLIFLLSMGLPLAVSFTATLVPARRASRIDPLGALRYE